ncbi:chemotaxis protein CheW [Leptolyngbya sp. NIES-2104]|uniref:chemotaxis protein CheW n=1 Tax=Leptolyngbya sp. NIES-2104 TaxID=1552121 RepID=UPI0006EC65AC|nr:chemotaxis protein CheW [Leptolyngbya sp. NIES-2104]GAP98225.1 CheW protein [Leptolyngbya sp. NIES-2104]
MKSSAIAVRSSIPRSLGQVYLKFDLGAKIPVVVPMNYVREAISRSLQHLTPMPEMPPYVLGLMHRQAQVMWSIDLAQLLEVGSINAHLAEQDFIILRVGSTAFAIAVHQIHGSTWLSSEEIQPSLSHATGRFSHYLSGCVLKKQEVMFVLDAEAIVQSPSFQHNELF